MDKLAFLFRNFDVVFDVMSVSRDSNEIIFFWNRLYFCIQNQNPLSPHTYFSSLAFGDKLLSAC